MLETFLTKSCLEMSVQPDEALDEEVCYAQGVHDNLPLLPLLVLLLDGEHSSRQLADLSAEDGHFLLGCVVGADRGLVEVCSAGEIVIVVRNGCINTYF